MLDLTTIQGRAIAAALRLAGERPWAGISLRDIADAAGVTLADLRGHIDSKSAVLSGLLAAVDDHVLRTAPRPDMTEAPRDRLFEVLMSRFDALAPYRAGLKSIVASAPLDASLIKPSLASQAWMLQAAGIDAEGIGGGVKTLGLATVYAQVFKVWLDDDDPGLARTMAALDRNLRSGERAIAGVDEAIKSAQRIVDTISSFVRGSRERSRPGTIPEPEAPKPHAPDQPAPPAAPA